VSDHAVPQPSTLQQTFFAPTPAPAPVDTSRSGQLTERAADDEHVRYVLLWALIVGIAYAAGALVGIELVKNPAMGTAFFPSAGVTLAALLLLPRRAWPAILVAVAIAEISVDLWQHQTVAMAFGFALANTLEPFVGASLTRMGPHRRRPTRLGFARLVLFGAVVGPIVGATIGGAVSAAASQGPFWSTAGKWWVGDAVGVLVVTPPILAWTRRREFEARAGTVEVVVVSLLAGALTVFPTLLWHSSVAFAVLPLLMWAALRAGPLGVGSAGLMVALGVDWLFSTGRANGLLAVGHGERALIEVQLYIAITLLAAHILAIEVSERADAEARARQSERARNRAVLVARDVADRERRRIARETHDIVGHALNVMLLTTAAARRTLDVDAQQARALLENVEEVGREAFGDLDVALGLIDQSRNIVPGNGINDLQDLVDRVGRAGLPVDLHLTGIPGNIPTLVDWSVYRIVQECLTNVMQHAANAHTTVEINFMPDTIAVRVVDDGSRVAPDRSRGGHGLAGMRERVEVMGGRLTAGARPGRGFEVIAEIPVGS
jgi:signal transduction histidine kinase